MGQFLVLEQQLTEMLELLSTSDFLFLKRHDHDVKIIIELDDLIEILLLHFVPGLAHFARIVGIENLIDHDVMDIDVEFSQLLDQTLSLVHRQEFRNTHRHEGCLLRVLHVLVHDLRCLTHSLHPTKDLVQSLVQLFLAPEDIPNLVQ